MKKIIIDIVADVKLELMRQNTIFYIDIQEGKLKTEIWTKMQKSYAPQTANGISLIELIIHILEFLYLNTYKLFSNTTNVCAKKT